VSQCNQPWSKGLLERQAGIDNQKIKILGPLNTLARDSNWTLQSWWYPKQIASNYCFAKVTSSEVFSWNLWPMCSRGPESLSSDCQCQLVSPVAPWIMAGCTDSQPSMFIPVCYNLLEARYKSDPGELSWFSALCGHLSLSSLTHSDCPCHPSCRCGCHHHDHYNRHQHHHSRRRDDDLDKQDRYADVKQYRLWLKRWNIHHYPFCPKY
jgi:hypothetical protein